MWTTATAPFSKWEREKGDSKRQTLWQWSTGNAYGRGEKRTAENAAKRTRLKELSLPYTNRKAKKNTKENSKPLVCKVHKRRRVLALCHPTNFLKKPEVYNTYTLNITMHKWMYRRGVIAAPTAAVAAATLNVQASEKAQQECSALNCINNALQCNREKKEFVHYPIWN